MIPASADTAPPSQLISETERQPQEFLKPIERAAKTINETLAHDARYPELDSYIGRKPFAKRLGRI